MVRYVSGSREPVKLFELEKKTVIFGLLPLWKGSDPVRWFPWILKTLRLDILTKEFGKLPVR